MKNLLVLSVVALNRSNQHFFPLQNSFRRISNFSKTPFLSHTFNKTNSIASMKIVQVPVLKDNYSYLIIDENNKIAAAVDPAGPKEVLTAAEKENVKITSVLTTHHHWDHAGGNPEMAKQVKNLKIYGGDSRVDALTDKVGEGDNFKIGDLNVKVYFTPCHTSGHVLYEVSDPLDSSSPSALFTGDTLFIGGCGRFFEGNAEQMVHALCEVIASLPGKTQIFCGHEYTVKNLEFAATIEPKNQALKDKMEWVKKQREQNLSTVPSTIEEELSFNPFMRVKEKSVAEAVGLANSSPAEVMQELRNRKNKF